MTDAIRDQNHVTVALGQSSTSSTTTLPFLIDSLTGRLLVNSASGSGDVVGPASATDNAVARFDGTTGKLLQNSVVIIADTTGNMSGSQQLTLGVAASATGKLLIKGLTSGTVTIQVADAAGTYTLTLPTDDGTNGQVLTTDGNGVLTWTTNGAGDVVGPASSTDNAVARFDGTTGKLLQNSTLSLGDTGPLAPFTDDAVALGDTTHNFSDLFLATGALINFANGNAVITHSSGILTVSTGDLRVTTAGTNAASVVTVQGSQSLTNKTYNGLTITTTSGTLTLTNSKTLSVTNTLTLSGTDGTTMTFPTTSATLARTDAGNTFTGVSTGSAWVLTSPTITTKISPTTDDGAPLGDTTHNFSDLFLASGAVINYANSNVVITHTSGILTMGTGELRITSANVGTNGDSVPTLSSTSTLTNKTLTAPTLGGATSLADGATIKRIVPTVDGTATGPTTAAFVSGYTSSAVGDLVYLDSSGKWQKTDSDALATTTGLLGIALAVAATDAALLVALPGAIVYATAFPTLTIGAPYYVGETAGAIQAAIPTGADNAVRVVGFGVHADKLYFLPSSDTSTTVA